MKTIDLAAFPTPYFVVDEARLRHNLAILKGVCERTGCKILLAQKAFSMFAAYPHHPGVSCRHHRQRPF